MSRCACGLYPRDRVAVAGLSFGGIVTVFASAQLDGFLAALDFAGAAQTWASAPRLPAAMTDAVTRAPRWPRTTMT